MGEEIHVIASWIILAGMRATALLAGERRRNGRVGAIEQVSELEPSLVVEAVAAVVSVLSVLVVLDASRMLCTASSRLLPADEPELSAPP